MADDKQQQGAQKPAEDPKQQANPREARKGGSAYENKGRLPYSTKDMGSDHGRKR